MGLLKIFSANSTIATHVAKSAKRQRSEVAAMRTLPMPQFIEQCLVWMHPEGSTWSGKARPARADAKTVVAAKRLPASLAEFYLHCDGIAGKNEFPTPVLPLAELKLGADYATPPSQVVMSHWKQHGNDSPREGFLMVLPPQDLGAIGAVGTPAMVRPQSLDMSLPLVPMRPGGFAVVLLAPAGEHLPAGSVLEYENGIATRFDDFRHWLANWASLFSSMRSE